MSNFDHRLKLLIQAIAALENPREARRGKLLVAVRPQQLVLEICVECEKDQL
jgi:hypothetical protein